MTTSVPPNYIHLKMNLNFEVEFAYFAYEFSPVITLVQVTTVPYYAVPYEGNEGQIFILTN